MSVDYTAKKAAGHCLKCLVGELHQFQEDAEGVLRCGRCGELHEPAAKKTAATTRKVAE
jgi:hypothetical protein